MDKTQTPATTIHKGSKDRSFHAQGKGSSFGKTGSFGGSAFKAGDKSRGA